MNLIVGGGLLPKTEGQQVHFLAGTPPSGASPLPQLNCGGSELFGWPRMPPSLSGKALSRLVRLS